MAKNKSIDIVDLRIESMDKYHPILAVFSKSIDLWWSYTLNLWISLPNTININ